MKKILSIFLASAMLSAPLAINANAKECGVAKILEKLSQGYTYEGVCQLDLSELSEKFKDFSYIFDGIMNGEKPDVDCENGNCESDDKAENEGSSSDIQISQNALANEVLNLVNKYRVQNGLSELVYDAGAECAATIRAKETEQLFSHTRPDGSRCFTALDECDVKYSGAGENIAMGQSSPEAVMNDWMNSQGHRENILNPNFKKLGVGVHKGSDGRYYWAQMFIY